MPSPIDFSFLCTSLCVLQGRAKSSSPCWLVGYITTVDRPKTELQFFRMTRTKQYEIIITKDPARGHHASCFTGIIEKKCVELFEIPVHDRISEAKEKVKGKAAITVRCLPTGLDQYRSF